MAEHSTIEWTEQTWNPVTGCDRVSPGCDNCYALTLAKRLKAMDQKRYQRDGDPRTSGPGFGLTVHPDALDIPLRRRKPTLWFVNSMSDLFHREVPDEFLARVFAVMAATPQHTYQVLTKRPQRAAAWLGDETTKHYVSAATSRALGVDPADYGPYRSSGDARRLGRAIGDARRAAGIDALFGPPWPLPNVWLGTSIENDRYTFRADHLRATPAAVRFLSLEPLLGPLPSLDLTGIDWVIVGGESGPGARPMNPSWVRDIRDRCVGAGVPFFFKQWGEWMPYEDDPQPPFFVSQHGDMIDGHHLPADISDNEPTGGWWWPDLDPDTPVFRRVGKKAAGRELDGRTWDQMPEAATR